MVDILKIENFGDRIEVKYVDGSKEAIENNIYERKDASGATVEQRPATADDFARLNLLTEQFEADLLATDANIVKVEITDIASEVVFDDGLKVEVGEGFFEIKDASGLSRLERFSNDGDPALIADLTADFMADLLATDAEIVKVEINGDNIEITLADGSKTQIEDGFLEVENAAGDTLLERNATPDDAALLADLAAAFEASLTGDVSDIAKAEIDEGNIEIKYVDGSKEEIDDGHYEFKNADGETVTERDATADDIARLTALVDAFSAGAGGGAGGPAADAVVVKIEVESDKIEVKYDDGSKEEIGEGRYEFKNADGATVVERTATADDIARLTALADAFSAGAGDAGDFPAPDATVLKAEIEGDKIEILYSDGTKEEVEDGVYELKSPAGNTIVERLATDDDIARIEALAADAPIIETDGGDGDHGGDDDRDEISGDDGDDDVRATDVGERISAGAGRDKVRGEGGDDQISGGDDDDKLFGGDDDDDLFGDDGDDKLRGDDGDDHLSGGLGDDRVKGGKGADLVDGDEGDDLVKGGVGEDTVMGGAGADKVKGNGGADMVMGEADDDRMQGGGGSDTLDGGTGSDIYNGGGGADTLVFKADGELDKINGFENDVDVIDISDFGLTGFDQVVAAASQDGDNVILDLGGGDIIKISDFDLADMDAGDFIL